MKRREDRTCSTPGCTRPFHARSYCRICNNRIYRQELRKGIRVRMAKGTKPVPTPQPPEAAPIVHFGEIRAGDWFAKAAPGRNHQRKFVWGNLRDGRIQLRLYSSGPGEGELSRTVRIANVTERELRTEWRPCGPNDNPMATIVRHAIKSGADLAAREA